MKSKRTTTLRFASDGTEALFRDLEGYKVMTREEEIALANRRDAGDRTAIDEFILRNMRFVRYFANAGYYRNKGLEPADLLQEGAIGLARAAEKFDQTKGCRFATYAFWWIRNSIQKAIADTGATIRVPIYRRDTRARLIKTVNRLFALGNANPAIEDIEAKTGYTTETIRTALEATPTVFSLDAHMGKESEEHPFIESLPDQSNIPADELLFREELARILNDLLNNLDPREKTIIDMRFGFIGYEVHSLQQTGDVIGLTRERIRQIQDKLLKELRTRLEAVQ